MSDTQKQPRPGATPIKNPLLSASVTGLTFDDFPNKPLLLPAAPPIVHTPATAPVLKTSGLSSREPKSLVTVGSSSLDTENLDEINLNVCNDDNQTSNTTDASASSFFEQSNTGTNADSILSQAASSFSALPSVASNVLSTFSKRFSAISSRETTPTSDQYQQDYNSNVLAPQLAIQPSYIPHSQREGSCSQIPPTFYTPPSAGNPLSSNFGPCQATPPAEPPKFYTPGEVPPIPSISTGPPPTSGEQNNFRFSSKKKLYAPIPGLSQKSQTATGALDPASVSAPISYDTSNQCYAETPYLTPKTEKLKSISLLSKVDNLRPSGGLQYIAGSAAQPSKSLHHPVSEQQHNFFPAQPPPPTTNYFVPQEQANTAYSASPYVDAKVAFSDQQTRSSQLVNPQQDSSPEEPQTQIPLLKPSGIQTQIIPRDSAASSLQTSPVQKPPPNVSSSELTPTGQPAAEQIVFLDPTKYLHPSSQLGVTCQSNPTTSAFPPSSPYSVPPKTSGQTSYRLQKGTKLYKNPLNSQETTRNSVTPNQIQATEVPLVIPTPFGEPLSDSSATNASAFFAPYPAFGIESLTTSHNQNVSFTPFIEETKSIETSQNIPSIPSGQASLPLFAFPPPSVTSSQDTSFDASTVEEQISHETPKSISPAPNQTGVPLPAPPPSIATNAAAPLSALAVEVESKYTETLPGDPFLAPINNNLVQSISKKNLQEVQTNVKPEGEATVSFAPPIKKLKSDESVLDSTKFTESGENKLVRELETTHEQNQKLISNVESKDPLATFEKHFLAQVSKPDSKPDTVDNTEDPSIFESIEPVFEPNITAVQEGKIIDPLEETLQKLSITAQETKAVTLPPIGESFNLKNPYRKSCNTENIKPAPTLPTLANFFTPEPSAVGASNLNFFTNLPPTQTHSNEVNFFSDITHATAVNKDNSERIKSTEPEPVNFFTKPFSSELAPLEPSTIVHPPTAAFFPKGSAPAFLEDNNAIKADLKEPFGQENLPPPKGFENIKQFDPTTFILPLGNKTAQLPSCTTIQPEISTQTQQPEVVNRFSNFFSQTNQQAEINKVPSSFFDSISSSQQQEQELVGAGPPSVATNEEQRIQFFDSISSSQQQEQQLVGTVPSSVATNEEQRIQFFFNNPPPKDASAVGDLNYDLIHSGLGIKNLQQRSLTPVSNLVEPPSSACSEFSEISNSAAGQKSVAATLSITESSEESNKSITEESSSDTRESNAKRYEDLPDEVLKELRMANLLSADKTSTSPVASVSYKPAVKHWFFKRTVNDKQTWIPFSHYDSALLETSLLMEGDEKSNIVAVEGSRYDVNISERKKMSVYWESSPIDVRRCSWFYKAVDSKYVPYEEQTADLLENEYKQAAESGVWHKTIVLGTGEQVVFHGPTVIVHFQQQQNVDAWGGTTQTTTRPRVVKRDLDDFNIEEGESQKVDHLLFMVHGIGSACDLKLRSVEEVVEDFRTIARQLVQSHYKNSTDLGLVGRVEVLPISWHSHLHSAEMGIDEKLRMITLESIPKLRNFTNDTLLDILFYTSPTFCQKIMNTIVSSMNTLYLKYRERHPEFNGGVSLAGHSLGSLILFDLLCHQNPVKESEEKNLENPDQFSTQMDSNQLEDKQMSYTMGPAGTGQPFIHYNQLIFQPKKFFALGSPIGMFVTIRGIDKLGLDFRLPTCPGFYNIFHPYDPVAYRIEALVNPDLSGIRPVLIPHHKGRKRMHLELKETMTRVSMDLKNRFLDKLKTTLDSVNIFGSSFKSTKEAEEMMEKEVDKVIQMQMQLEQQNHNDNLPSGSDCTNDSALKPRQRTDSVSTAMSDDAIEIDFPLGKLNDSKRIDYVLQEAPLEFINEYIFALSSHVCYWDSEDTILFVMKEIYSGLGISPDSQVPQQTMTIERPSSRNSLIS